MQRARRRRPVDLRRLGVRPDHPVAEVFPHFKSRALVWLNTVAPGLTDRVVKRFGRKPLR